MNEELDNLIAITVQKLDRQVSKLIDVDCFDDDVANRPKISCNIHHLLTILDILNEEELSNNELIKINYALFNYEEGDIDINSLLNLNLDALLGLDVTVPLTCDCPPETTPVSPFALLNIPTEDFFEIGSNSTVPLSITFQQNNAGDPTAFEIRRNGTAVINTQSGSDTLVIPAGTVSYVGQVDYGAGPVNDHNNNPFEPGPISAGVLTTEAKQIKTGYPWFWGTHTSSDISGLNLYTAGNKVVSDSSERIDIVDTSNSTNIYYWVAVPAHHPLKLTWGAINDIVDSGTIGGTGDYFAAAISRNITSNDLAVNWTQTFNVFVTTSAADSFNFFLTNVFASKVVVKVSEDNETLSQLISELNFIGNVNISTSGNKATIEVLNSSANITTIGANIDDGSTNTQTTWSSFKIQTELDNITVGSGHTIQNEGTGLTQRANLNFVGASVTVTDDPGNNATVVTIAASAGTAVGTTFTPAGNIVATNVQAAIEELDNEKEPVITTGTTSQYYRGDKTFQTLDKTAVGLANVDNTSDANKPVSTAQAAADTAVQNFSIQRSNHTGTQTIATITGLQTALDAKENGLGNPASDGEFLSSTIAGVRSWGFPTLQQVVSAGSTSNIQITINDADISIPTFNRGVLFHGGNRLLGNTGSLSASLIIRSNASTVSRLGFQNSLGNLTGYLQATDTDDTFVFRTGDAVTTAARVKGADGTESDDFVTLSQLQNAGGGSTPGTPINHTVAGIISLDLDTLDTINITVDADITQLNLSNGSVRHTPYIVRMIQGSTGGDLIALGSGIRTLNGVDIILSANATEVDFLKIWVEASGSYLIEPIYP